MKTKIEPGFFPPINGSYCFVELENGIVTGAKYQKVIDREDHEQVNFKPIGVSMNCNFSSPVKYWLAGVSCE